MVMSSLPLIGLFLNAFFSSLCNVLLLLPYWSSSPRRVILMHISLEIIHNYSYQTRGHVDKIFNIHMHSTIYFSFPTDQRHNPIQKRSTLTSVSSPH